MTTRLRQLSDHGVAVWVDSIARDWIQKGELRRLRDQYEVVGVTSNPTIFQKAMGEGSFYDDDIARLAGQGLDARAIFESLALDDIRAAARDGESHFLFGDVSGIAQINRAGPALVALLEREEWHPRLLNGSDYPLPGIVPLYSVSQVVGLGVIERRLAPVLAEVREHNPLLFDFVLKRHLRAGSKRFPASVFETRAFLDRNPAGAS